MAAVIKKPAKYKKEKAKLARKKKKALRAVAEEVVMSLIPGAKMLSPSRKLIVRAAKIKGQKALANLSRKKRTAMALRKLARREAKIEAENKAKRMRVQKGEKIAKAKSRAYWKEENIKKSREYIRTKTKKISKARKKK